MVSFSILLILLIYLLLKSFSIVSIVLLSLIFSQLAVLNYDGVKEKVSSHIRPYGSSVEHQ